MSLEKHEKPEPAEFPPIRNVIGHQIVEAVSQLRDDRKFLTFKHIPYEDIVTLIYDKDRRYRLIKKRRETGNYKTNSEVIGLKRRKSKCEELNIHETNMIYLKANNKPSIQVRKIIQYLNDYLDFLADFFHEKAKLSKKQVEDMVEDAVREALECPPSTDINSVNHLHHEILAKLACRIEAAALARGVRLDLEQEGFLEIENDNLPGAI